MKWFKCQGTNPKPQRIEFQVIAGTSRMGQLTFTDDTDHFLSESEVGVIVSTTFNSILTSLITRDTNLSRSTDYQPFAFIVHSDVQDRLTPSPLPVLTSSFSSQSSITFMPCLNFPDSLKSSLRDIWLHPFCRGTKNTRFSQLSSEALWLHLWIMEILRSSTRHNWSVIAPLRQWQCLVVVVFVFLLKFCYQSNWSIKQPLREKLQSDKCFILWCTQQPQFEP